QVLEIGVGLVAFRDAAGAQVAIPVLDVVDTDRLADVVPQLEPLRGYRAGRSWDEGSSAHTSPRGRDAPGPRPPSDIRPGWQRPSCRSGGWSCWASLPRRCC